jgi:uncharacterized membrane protein
VSARTIAFVVVVSIVPSLPFFAYEWNLFLHLLGAVAFLGNIIVTAVWMSLARKSGEPSCLRFAVRGVIVTDVYFTTPGVILLLLNGGILSTGWFKSGQASWIVVALGLFVLSGIAWFGFLIPLQRDMSRVCSVSGGPDDDLPPEFYGLLARWYRWGLIATLLPLLTLGIMVIKPNFW